MIKISRLIKPVVALAFLAQSNFTFSEQVKDLYRHLDPETYREILDLPTLHQSLEHTVDPDLPMPNSATRIEVTVIEGKVDSLKRCGLVVDYGDGKIQEIQYSPGQPLILEHTYTLVGQFKVVVSGKRISTGVFSEVESCIDLTTKKTFQHTIPLSVQSDISWQAFNHRRVIVSREERKRAEGERKTTETQMIADKEAERLVHEKKNEPDRTFACNFLEREAKFHVAQLESLKKGKKPPRTCSEYFFSPART